MNLQKYFSRLWKGLKRLKEIVQMKTEFQQMQESGILVLQQKAEDNYWDSYIEEEAQKGFEEYKNSPIIKIGDKEYRRPFLLVPDLPTRCYYTVYDYEHPETCKYNKIQLRKCIGKRYSELVREYGSDKDSWKYKVTLK